MAPPIRRGFLFAKAIRIWYIEIMEYGYDQFKRDILKLTDIDLDSYKEKQMKRRIDSLLQTKGVEDYFRFVRMLRSDQVLLEEFIEYVTINVSEFFRNPEQWEILEKEVIPRLESKEKIRIWSAACSTGDEPYSLAMLFMKHFPKERFSIVATDIDEKAIKMAKAGEYHPKSVEHMPKEYFQYFTRNENGKYLLSNEIKRMVTFKKHNLFKDEYPRMVDLLVCRNVLIYFTEDVKADIFRKFYKSISGGGVLFLGNTEQMMDYKEIGYKRISSFFYEK